MTDTLGPELVRVPAHTTTAANLPETLQSLWRAACDDGGAVSRALTINFVAVAPCISEISLRRTAESLISRSPARAFLLSIDDSVGEPRVEVAAVTRRQGKLRDVLLEEIFVRLPRRWFAHVPGLVRPMLINDLPTHLYWAGDWSDDADFAALRLLSDHCIVDSKQFSLPAVQLARLNEQRDSSTRITDLSWLRLSPWRRALAEGFERVAWQGGREARCVVRHSKHGAAAAILLAQWLESKLGARVDLEDSAVVQDACPESVTLDFDNCQIAAQSDGKGLSVHVTTPNQCFLPFRLPCSRGQDGDLLAAAIDIA